MTCRLLWAGLFLAVLLGPLSRLHQACAKPPDLPLDQKNTCKEEVVLRQNIDDLAGGNSNIDGTVVGNEAGSYGLPDPNVPPDGILSGGYHSRITGKADEQSVEPISHATRLFYQLPLGVRRNLAASILFTFHPLFVLTPTQPLLDIPEDHPMPRLIVSENPLQDMPTHLPAATCPRGFSCVVSDDVSGADCIVLWGRWLRNLHCHCAMKAAEPLPDCPNPLAQVDSTTSPPEESPCVDPVSTPPAPEPAPCPWHPQPIVDRYAQQLADPDVTRDVLTNLECQTKARKLLERAEMLGRAGHLCEALDCFQMVEELCPGRFDDRIQSIMTDLCMRLYGPAQEDAIASASASEEQSTTGKATCGLWHTIAGYLRCPCCCESQKESTEEESASSACPKCEKMHRRCVARCAKKKNPPLVFVTYAVSDLLDEDLDVLTSKDMPSEEKLIRFLTYKIEPRSWREMGGTCTIDYFALTQSLVVGQTPENQEQVAQTLAMLRQKVQEKRAIRVQVTALLKACRLALTEGHYAQAADLARQACALDPERVQADPLVYKMQLLTNGKSQESRGSTEDSEAAPPTCPFLEMLPGARQASATGVSHSQFLAVCTALGEVVDTLLPAHGGVELGLGFPPGRLSVGYSLPMGGVVFHVRYHAGSVSMWLTANKAE